MFELKLASVPNPDRDEWFAPGPLQVVSVKSLLEASRKCKKYIAEYNLGAGNWVGGQVSKNNKQVARISYNGKIWKA